MDISVIIPVRNGELYIGQCLESVFSQTFKGEYEVILGVDPSTDDTFEVAKMFLKDHPNLALEHRRGLGVSINRMDSIKAAKGKYICFLDADDYYAPEFLEKMYNEISKGFDVVNCSFYVNRDGRIEKNGFVKNTELDSVGACTALLKDSYMRGFLWNKMFKRELFEIKPLPIFRARDAIFEDSMLLYYLLMHCQKVKSISTPLYYYRDNATSITKRENKQRYFYHLYTFGFIRHLCDEEENKRYLKGFRRTMFRSTLSLWFDIMVSCHVLKHKDIKEKRPLLKAIRSRKPLDITQFGLAEFIADLFKPLD